MCLQVWRTCFAVRNTCWRRASAPEIRPHGDFRQQVNALRGGGAPKPAQAWRSQGGAGCFAGYSGHPKVGVYDFSLQSNSAWAKEVLAARRMSLGCGSSLLSSFSSFRHCASAIVALGRLLESTSARLPHSSSICGTQPIFGAIDSKAAATRLGAPAPVAPHAREPAGKACFIWSWLHSLG